MFSRFRNALILLFFLLTHGNLYCQSISSVAGIDQIIHQAMEQYKGMINSNSNTTQYPRSTNKDGSINFVDPSDWTSGFFPGSLWYLYEYTNKSTLLDQATRWTSGLESEKWNTGTHDIGFIFNTSYGNGYRLMDDPGYEEVLIQSANSLSTRFNEKVGCIRSWDFGSWNYPVIIDNMMNLELLFKASEISHNPSYRDKAVSHANTTMANHFRADYSSYHVVDYNKTNGSVISKSTHQGYSKESAWARGQAWGLYGFTMCYRYTKDKRYLKLAENIAQFMIGHKNFPADRIPYWDFDDPKIPNAPRDVSAATVMCSALFELSRYSEQYGKTFLDVAIQQINSLSSSQYTAEIGTNNHFILMHGTGNMPGSSEVDSPLNYADYYYLEALSRYRRVLNHSPIVDLTYLQDDNSSPLKINFDASLTTDSDNDSLTFAWDFGDGKKAFTYSKLISHVYGSPGVYSVTLKTADKWNGADTLQQNIAVKPLTGVSKLEGKGLSVYPNPASKSFTIELPYQYGPTSVSIANLLGQKYQMKLNPGRNLILSANWKDSLYIIYFETPDGIQQAKLMIKNES